MVKSVLKMSHDRVAGLGGDSTHVLSPGQFNVTISPQVSSSPAVLYQPIILIFLPAVANHKHFVV